MATKSSGPDLPTLEKQAVAPFFTEALWRKYELELTGFFLGLVIVLLAGVALKFSLTAAGVIFTLFGAVVSVISFIGIIFKWAEEN